MKKYTLLFLLVFLAAPLANGQWLHKKGNGYYKLSARFLEADEHFTDTGDIDPNATRGLFSTNFYGEYGISENWNVVAYVPFFTRTYQNDQVSGTTQQVLQEGEAVNSLGDIELGITYALVKGKFPVSTTLTLGIPTGEDAGGSDGSYQTGDGEFNQFLKINAGTSYKIGKTSSYFKSYIGFNNRTNQFSDEVRFGAETGFNFLKNKLWVTGRLDVIQSTFNGTATSLGNGSLFSNNIEFTALGGELSYFITKKLGISASYTSALGGRIAFAAPSYSAGIFLSVK